MRHYATYCDHRYLPRALALHRSLAAAGGPFRLWVLCLSPEASAILGAMGLPGVRPLDLSELEAADPVLLAAKADRGIVEYYFTCTPALVRHVFRSDPAADLVTYLDADLYFFGDPEGVFAEIGEASIAIVPHRFPDFLKDHEAAGIYNVGWVSFRRDAEGLACLERWREQCLEWCYDRIEEGRFADQKYLDAWPGRHRGVAVLGHPGINLAPWNLANHRLAFRGGKVMVDGMPLLFFHFHALRRLKSWIYDPGLEKPYRVRLGPVLASRVYRPYLRALNHFTREVSRHKPDALPCASLRFEEGKAVAPERRPPLPLLLVRYARWLIHAAAAVAGRRFVAVWPPLEDRAGG